MFSSEYRLQQFLLNLLIEKTLEGFLRRGRRWGAEGGGDFWKAEICWYHVLAINRTAFFLMELKVGTKKAKSWDHSLLSPPTFDKLLQMLRAQQHRELQSSRYYYAQGKHKWIPEFGCRNILFLQWLVIKVTSWISCPTPSSLSSSYTSTANLGTFVDRGFSAELLANSIAAIPTAAELAGMESPLHVNEHAS